MESRSVIDEEWTVAPRKKGASEDTRFVSVHRDGIPLLYVDASMYGTQEKEAFAVQRLASLAPRMARAILKHEWVPLDEQMTFTQSQCPECERFVATNAPASEKRHDVVCALGSLCDELRAIAGASS